MWNIKSGRFRLLYLIYERCIINTLYAALRIHFWRLTAEKSFPNIALLVFIWSFLILFNYKKRFMSSLFLVRSANMIRNSTDSSKKKKIYIYIYIYCMHSYTMCQYFSCAYRISRARDIFMLSRYAWCSTALFPSLRFQCVLFFLVIDFRRYLIWLYLATPLLCSIANKQSSDLSSFERNFVCKKHTIFLSKFGMWG